MTDQQSNATVEKRKSRGAQWGAVGIFIVIVAISGWRLLEVQKRRAERATFIPTCDAPVVREAVQDAVEQNAAKNIATLRLLDMQNVRELKANPTQRLCSATLVLNSGDTPTRFIVSLATTGDTLVELGDDLDIQVASAQGGVATAPAAPVAAAAASSANIPPAELADLYNPPNPATVDAVVARARELCAAQGSEEHAVTFDELREMAGGKIAAFEAAGRRGFRRTAADDACYRDAKEILRDYNADGSRVGDEAPPQTGEGEVQ